MLLSLLLALSVQSSDTLVVKQAQAEGPYPVQLPLLTDSVNMQGKAFDIQEVLNENNALVSSTRVRKAVSLPIRQGDALTVGSDSLPTLRILRFTVQTPRFVKARVEVKQLKSYKLYVNGKECADKNLTLTPGRAELVLQVLTQKADKDSFDVRLVGENLDGVEVNATSLRPYTMADMMLGDHYRSVNLSPSGKYLVTTSYYMKPNGQAQYTTTLTEMATGKELMHRNEYIELNWLPSERDVLYYTRPGGIGKELVVFTPENGKEQVLADNLPQGGFRISPKEDYLIFSKVETGKGSKYGLKRLQEPDDRMPGWRNRNSLWRYDLKSGLMQRLTFGSAGIYLADISQDGRHLLLQYSRFDANKAPFQRTGILRMDAYTGKTDTLLTDTAFVASARFSPDAKQLLISASPAAFNGIGSEVKPGQVPNAFDYRLYLYDIACQKTTPLLRNFGPAVEDYQWSCGDGKVYFVATDRTDRSLFSLDMKSHKVTRYELPVTMVQDYTIATRTRQPRAVFFGNTIERAREMFTCQLNKEKPEAQRIGFINFDKLAEGIAIGTCHTWRFMATRGDSIDGFYLLPPDFDASKKYPLIVYYYGGCTPTTKSLEFQYPLQVLAGQGYVVYVPNPSGAIGYGQEFAARHVNTWGKESGDDIIEGTKKFCAAHPFIDQTKIGCMGASYGGFMTQYLQTQTDIFATAISHAGISNIASYWGGGYWGYSYGECAQYGNYPWNNPELYVKQSPLFNADKIHTPLLLLHGTVDTNVPTNESQQLFTALKILGREVAYVQVEGQDHVVVDYHKRLAWQNAIFAWFAKYLKGDSTWWNELNL